MKMGDDVSSRDVMRFIVSESGLSARQISLAMGMDERYVARAINKNKDVQASTIAKTCDGTAKAPNPVHVYIESGGVFHRMVL